MRMRSRRLSNRLISACEGVYLIPGRVHRGLRGGKVFVDGLMAGGLAVYFYIRQRIADSSYNNLLPSVYLPHSANDTRIIEMCEGDSQVVYF